MKMILIQKQLIAPASIFLLLFLTILTVPAPQLYAQSDPIEDTTKELANQVMKDIFDEIIKVKGSYKELQAFDETALSKNAFGVYKIEYAYKLTDDKLPAWKRTPYAFGLTVDGISDKSFSAQEGMFNYGFPLLGVKFSGYQKRHLLRTQYDILPLLGKYGNTLANYEQNFLPLRLTLSTTKDVYKVREDIKFQVILKNVSKRHMIVKNLGQETLYFVLNDQTWGTRPYSNITGGADVILKSGESLTTTFKGESFQKPQDVNISAVYRMSIKGVNPSGVLKIKVVE